MWAPMAASGPVPSFIARNQVEGDYLEFGVFEGASFAEAFRSVEGHGTIIIVQDWFRFKGDPRRGKQRACAEWLARNPQFELIEYWREGPQAVSFW
jgi:hypothetical protein